MSKHSNVMCISYTNSIKDIYSSTKDIEHGKISGGNVHLFSKDYFFGNQREKKIYFRQNFRFIYHKTSSGL